jgi:acetamidase/formamidase
MTVTYRALLMTAALALVPLASAQAQVKPDYVLRSTVENVKRGFISADTAPVLKIKSGQIVRIDTISHGGVSEDPVAFFGQAGIKPDEVLDDVKAIAKATKENGWAGHILTGPIYVEGAEPGDMLEIRILNVEPRVPYGVNSPGPGGAAPGILTERGSRIIKYDIKRKVVFNSPGVETPLGPFMGIMAVAPGDPRKIGSRAPGPYGGNMDFAKLQAGATLYLPVFQPGALFVTGDSHAAQGDGEVSGNAIEASMTPTLQFIVHKGAGKALTTPYAEDAQNYYIMGMDKDLDVALKHAIEETVKFLVANKGMTPLEAYSLCSTAVDFGVAEAVDENLVMYGKVSKSWFKAKAPYWTK